MENATYRGRFLELSCTKFLQSKCRVTHNAATDQIAPLVGLVNLRSFKLWPVYGFVQKPRERSGDQRICVGEINLDHHPDASKWICGTWSASKQAKITARASLQGCRPVGSPYVIQHPFLDPSRVTVIHIPFGRILGGCIGTRLQSEGSVAQG